MSPKKSEPCLRKGCTNPAWKYRVCKHHYQRCIIEDCDRPQIAHGLCPAHYKRMKRIKEEGATLGLNERLASRAAVGPNRGIRFPAEVDAALVTTAEQAGSTLYELVQKIVVDWYEAGRVRAAPAAVVQLRKD